MLVKADLETAQQALLKYVRPIFTETLPIMSALGRVSAAEVKAPADLPVNSKSAVDGYALSELNEEAEKKYHLSGSASMSEIPAEPLKPGQAFGVVTGGNLPLGTKAVIPHEKADIKNCYLYPREEVKPGNNIKHAGEDFVRGDVLIKEGVIIGPADISLLAASGITSVNVYSKPRVAVLCLSENIVPWEAEPEPGKVRDSNGPLLQSLIIQDGGIPASCVVAAGKSASVKAALAELLDQIDVLVITGGTYADGENEVSLLMQELGADLLYWDVPIQPGSHTGAAVLDSRLFFALSGNPAACAVGYHLFVAPVLRAMQGLTPGLQRMTAACANGFPKKSGSRRFIRGQLSWTRNGWQVSVLPGQKPSMIRSLIKCNALIDMPADSPPINPGEEVSVIVLAPLMQGFARQ